MNVATTIRFVITMIGMIIVVLIANMQIGSYLKERAIDNCGRISRYQTVLPDQNATVWYPIEDMYKQCLRDKGYGSIADQK